MTRVPAGTPGPVEPTAEKPCCADFAIAPGAHGAMVSTHSMDCAYIDALRRAAR